MTFASINLQSGLSFAAIVISTAAVRSSSPLLRMLSARASQSFKGRVLISFSLGRTTLFSVAILLSSASASSGVLGVSVFELSAVVTVGDAAGEGRGDASAETDGDA